MRGKRKSEDEFAGVVPTPASDRVTPLEIQQKEFRLAFRGYNERDVDTFLDEVTEEFARVHAENKRLREQLEMGGATPVGADSAGEADAIVQRAREDAARILSQAEERARRIEQEGTSRAASSSGTPSGSAASPGGGGHHALGPFLSRERDFLQRLAGLIQQHAEAVKDDVRQARDRAPATAGPAEPSGGPAPGEGAAPSEPSMRSGDPAVGGAAAPGAASTAPPGPGREASPSGEDRSRDREATRAWSVGELADATGRPPGPEPGSERARVVDLTRPAGEGLRPAGSRIGAEPEDRPRASTDGADRLEEHDRSERSLKELFWGEDQG